MKKLLLLMLIITSLLHAMEQRLAEIQAMPTATPTQKGLHKKAVRQFEQQFGQTYTEPTRPAQQQATSTAAATPAQGLQGETRRQALAALAQAEQEFQQARENLRRARQAVGLPDPRGPRDQGRGAGRYRSGGGQCSRRMARK